MCDMALSINLYLYNLMADERQRGRHEIVQSPEDVDIEDCNPQHFNFAHIQYVLDVSKSHH